MKRLATLAGAILMISSAAAATLGVGRSFALRLAPGEHISAAAVREDGSAILALSTGRNSSRLLFVDANGESSTADVRDMRINRVTAISPGTLLVGGNGPLAPYSYRLVGVRAGGIVPMWDSARLSIGRREHVVATDASGSMWAAAHASRDRLVVMIGSFPRYDPALTVELAPRRDVARQLGLDPGYASILFLDREPAKPLVAVQWLGASYLIQIRGSGSSAVRKVLSTKHGPVTAATWDSEAKLLWLKSRRTWSAYDVRDLDRSEPRLVAEFSPEVVGSEPFEVIPLDAGRVAFNTIRPDGVRELQVATIQPAAVIATMRMPEARHWVASRNRGVIGVLPDFPRSRMMIVHRLQM